MSATEGAISILTVLPILKVEGVIYRFGAYKMTNKWLNQMVSRGWTSAMIEEAIAGGKAYSATNYINPMNRAVRYVHPKTGQSVVIDEVTKEVIHLGGPGFKY